MYNVNDLDTRLTESLVPATNTFYNLLEDETRKKYIKSLQTSWTAESYDEGYQTKLVCTVLDRDSEYLYSKNELITIEGSNQYNGVSIIDEIDNDDDGIIIDEAFKFGVETKASKSFKVIDAITVTIHKFIINTTNIRLSGNSDFAEIALDIVTKINTNAALSVTAEIDETDETGATFIVTAKEAGTDGNDIICNISGDNTFIANMPQNLAGGEQTPDTGTFFSTEIDNLKLAHAWLVLYELVLTAQQIVKNDIIFTSNQWGEGNKQPSGVSEKKALAKWYYNKALSLIQISMKMDII